MSHVKSVLFVISTMTGGGAERTVSTLSKFLSKEMKCSVLLNSRSNNDYEFQGNILSLGMKPKVKKGYGYQFIAAIKRYRELKRLKKTGNYDVVISFMESANFINILTGKEKCKLILSVRNVIGEEYKGLNRIILLIARLLYRHADYVVPLSASSKRDLIDRIKVPREKCITIYNGYDLTKCYNNPDKGRIRFITMGRLIHQKGQWHLIRAFKKVKESVPGATLQILGQGAYEGYLRELIKTYDLEESVKLVGYVKDPEKYLRQSDCFVFPSVYEGFGNAIIEAMMNGLPVIAADFCAVREIIAPELDDGAVISRVTECSYGILTPASSPLTYKASDERDHSEQELANAMIGFAKGEIGGRYDADNLERCLARFSIEESVDRWLKAIG